jgi:hypothetical protein
LEVDLKKDWFHVSYDSERLTTDRMLESMRMQGFQGEIVKNASASPSTSIPGKLRRDLTRLPEDLRKEVQKAKQEGKPLLLAIHGPG